MSAHTKEPWVAVEGIIYPSNGLESGEDWIADLRSAGNSDANERRIVACVNAMAGYPTETIEAFGQKAQERLTDAEQQRDELASVCAFNETTMLMLIEQRDELLAALRGLFNDYGEHEYDITSLNRARAAIDKADRNHA